MHKVRLAVDGAGQEVGVDCREIQSNVKPTIIRNVLSLTLSKSWLIH